MGAKVWGLIGLAFCGIVFVLWPRDLFWSANWGHLLGIISGLTHGLALTLVRRYSHDNSPVTPFFYFCLVGTIVSVGAMSLSTQAVELNRAGLAALAAIAVTACLAQLCMLKSATCITSAEVGIIGMSEIVFAGLLSFVFFSEAVGLRQLCGGMLVITSGIVLALDSGRDAQLADMDSAHLPGVKTGAIHP
jgi:drug/metabolite transporter (DMT)-like permease